MKTLISTLLLILGILSFQTAQSQTPVPCEEPYPQVQNLSASVDEVEENITLSWTPIIGSLGCRIQVRELGNTSWINRQIVEPDLEEFTINGLLVEFQTEYEARVACGCSANPLIIGDFSEIVTFNTGSAGQQVPCEDPYPAVSNPSSAPSVAGDAIEISWDPIPQSAGCQIEYSLLEGGTLNAAQVLESELSSFSIPETDLIPNQDYQWRVRCGCSLNPLVAGPWIEYQDFNSGSVGELSLPDADFRAQPICAVEGKSVLFTNLVGDSAQTYLWDFGDGTTSTEINPSKVYSSPGVYTVSLTVSNSSAQAGEVKSEYVTVNAGTCPASVTDIDGNTYEVVQICEDCWMAENLKTSKYANGDDIPLLTNNTWYSTSSGAFNTYSGESNYGSENEKYYNWYTTADSRDLCPNGWHVSSEADWIDLELALGMPSDEVSDIGARGIAANVGGALKSQLFDPPNQGATNLVEFNASGIGIKNCCINSQGTWKGINENQYFWTTVSSGSIIAINRSVSRNTSGIGRNIDHKRFGFSIRCVQD